MKNRLPRWKRLAQIDPAAITVGKTIYFKPGIFGTSTYDDFNLIAHEVTHVEQYQELGGWIPFSKKYFGEYFENRKKDQPEDQAYENTSLEVDAQARADEIEKDLRRRFPNDPSCGCGEGGAE